MLQYDINCLVGNWPFYRVGKPSFLDLKEAHAENGINCGFVASLDAIFYNDPFQGDESLHEILKGSSYQHILTINPTLPDFQTDITKGVQMFNIAGVRIYPGYHGFQMTDKRLDLLCETLQHLRLPLFITLRMEDERLSHLLIPSSVSITELDTFVRQHRDLKIIVLGAKFGEILDLSDLFSSDRNVYFDTSCFVKDYLFSVEKLTAEVGTDKMLYGSLYPLNCMKSTILPIQTCEDTGTASKILSLNFQPLLKDSRSGQR